MCTHSDLDCSQEVDISLVSTAGELLGKIWSIHSMKCYVESRTNGPDVYVATCVALKKKVLRKKEGTE